jgi:hypothetical protein
MNTVSCPYAVFPVDSLDDAWPLDESYMKIVAVIEMFLNRFPENSQSVLKTCMLRSHFKDRTTLMSVGYFSNLVNLTDESHFLDWLYTEKQALEIVSKMNANEEIMEKCSYFPYQADLWLVNKTFYSALKIHIIIF